MSFREAIRVCLSKYAVFEGRARRAEYWWFALFCFLVSLGLQVVDGALFGSVRTGLLAPLFSLATLLPSLGVTVRRLHDIGRSGWWFWLILVPLVGWIVLLVFLVRPGDRGPNRFGADPLEPPAPPGLAPTVRSAVPQVPRR